MGKIQVPLCSWFLLKTLQRPQYERKQICLQSSNASYTETESKRNLEYELMVSPSPTDFDKET